MLTEQDVSVPADVPADKRYEYKKNFLTITRSTGNLMLFAGDQKIEHLNSAFYGEGISEDDADPEHLFRIAQHATIGCFATQYGLIARYGLDYNGVGYLVKINSKTNIIPKAKRDPYSSQLVTIDDIMLLKENGLRILGVGYTIYLGSKYEAKMLKEASRIIADAHKQGLITVLWVYPRGDSVTHEKDPHLIAGACGAALCLGADFVKVNYPVETRKESKEIFKESVLAAGRCGVVCAGGGSVGPREFLQDLWDQINISGARGNATGRNIHQKPLDQAVRMCNAISAIVLGKKSVDEAMDVYEGRAQFNL